MKKPQNIAPRAGRSNIPAPSEAQIHGAVIEYFGLVLRPGVVVHHSPNEGRRSLHAQRAIKAAGVRAGWPDLELIADGRAWFIEFKAPGKYPTPVQRACHEDLAAAGCAVAICRSLDEAIEAVTGWELVR